MAQLNIQDFNTMRDYWTQVQPRYSILIVNTSSQYVNKIYFVPYCVLRGYQIIIQLLPFVLLSPFDLMSVDRLTHASAFPI